jgi:outer membrane lipoprotein-sorting protein
MALKIFTGAKPFLKAYIKPFGITEIEMLTYRSSALLFYAVSIMIPWMLAVLDLPRRSYQRRTYFMKKFTIFCVVGLFLMTSLTSPGLAQSAKDILDKMIEAQGGKASLAKIKDTTTSGTMEMVSMGLSGSLTIYQKEPNKMRMDMELMGMVMTQAYDGEIAWGLDPNTGSIQEIPAEQAQDIKRMALGSDSTLHPEKYGITYSYMGKETIEGQDFHLLKQAFEDGFSATLYVNAKTYLVHKTKSKAPNQMGMEVDQEVFATDYRKVEGIMVAHAIRILQDGEEFLTMTFTEVAINTGLEDSLFKKEE